MEGTLTAKGVRKAALWQDNDARRPWPRYVVGRSVEVVACWEIFGSRLHARRQIRLGEDGLLG